MLTVLLLWAQQQAHGLDLTGDDFRTAMIGALLAIAGYIARKAGGIRDDVRDMKRDIHGSAERDQPGIIGMLALYGQRLDRIEARNIAIDAVVEAEADMYPGPDRRRGARRLIDALREAHDATPISDEHPIPKKRKP